MEKTTFTTTIHAPSEKVWDILWNDETYPQWTSVFSEGSCAQSDWKKGSKILFGDGKGNGMVSVIDDLVPNEFMSFKHLGEMKDGVEHTEAIAWSRALENYYLKDVDGTTELTVEIDLTDEFKEMFQDTFPKALAIVKELSEQS